METAADNLTDFVIELFLNLWMNALTHYSFELNTDVTWFLNSGGSGTETFLNGQNSKCCERKGGPNHHNLQLIVD